MYCMLFVCLCFVKFSAAHIVQAANPINQTCVALGHKNDCNFYKCFEQRFPCGPTYWILKWGYKYCTRMQKSLLNFDKNGQQLIEKISSCFTSKLVKLRYYTLNNINCEKLRSAGQRMVHECYIMNAALFCNAFDGKNRDCFFQLIDKEDQHDLTVIRTLLSVGQKCTPKKTLAEMRPNARINQCNATSKL